MKYDYEKEYLVEIELVDKSVDRFSLKGEAVEKLREKIYQHGYTRDDKANKGKRCFWISPFVISVVTVTDKNQTLTDK